MRKVFKHFSIGEEVRSAAGGYIIQKEAVTIVAGKEVLYYTASAFFDTSCCGAGGCGYAVVAGYLVKHKFTQDEHENTFSELETVDSEAEREEIRKMLRESENLDQVVFL